MARLWAQTVTFQSISLGDQLPILVKWETRESIQRRRGIVAPEEEAADDESGPELTVEAAVLESYVTELLGKAFPPDSIAAPGSRLQMEHLAPVRPDDTIGFSGEVVGKRREGSRGLVECAIVVENQAGETVGRAAATVSLDLDSGGQDAPRAS